MNNEFNLIQKNLNKAKKTNGGVNTTSRKKKKSEVDIENLKTKTSAWKTVQIRQNIYDKYLEYAQDNKIPPTRLINEVLRTWMENNT